MRTSTVGRPGSLNAPLGSADWSMAMRGQMDLILHRHDLDHKSLQRLFKAFREEKGWATLTAETGTP